MVEALTKLGEAARRAREYISPWAYLSPSDVASNLPGGGIPAAVEPYKQGLQKTAEATQAFREGRWGDAARWYGSGMLDTATAGLSALPEGGAMAKLAMAMVPAFHGSKMKGLTEIAPSPRGALGPGAYFTPNENIARQYAGPEGQIYGTKIDDATIFQGIRSQDSSVNPYQVWRDQTAKLVDAAEPEMKQAVADLASRMDPNDGYPFWVRLAQLYKSEDGAQSLLKRAGFKGISGVADGPEIAMFDSVPLQSKSGLTEPEGAMQKLSGIRAFHGSPHDFDRFDMSKIGTGEGAQAYGHGLYFAEAEDVAKGYRQRLAGPASVAVSGSTQQPFADLADATKRFIADNPAGHPVMDRTRQDIGSSVAKWLGEEAGGGPSAAPMIAKLVQEYPEEVRPQVQQWADEIVGHLRPMMKVEQPGRMYEVRINADPEHFLDWDKPLSEQPVPVRNAIDKIYGVEPDEAAQLADPMFQKTGQGIYQMLLDSYGRVGGTYNKGNEGVTSAFREAGIHGIKYLDAGSRGAGDGTRNYVVFDDKLVEIIRKYGWAPGMAIPAAMALEMQQAQEQSAPQM